MKQPVLDGVPLATVGDLETLRSELAELKQQLQHLVSRSDPDSARQAIACLQAGYASMTEEERSSLADSERAARLAFDRGRSGD